MTSEPVVETGEQAASEHPPPSSSGADAPHPLLRAGRYAWAAVGVIALLVVLGLLAGQLVLVVVPLIIALFPAALLEPVARGLKRVGVPAALASLLTIVGSLLLLAGLVTVLVPVVAAELPDLAESFGEGVEDLQGMVEGLPFAPDIGGADQLLQRGREQLGEAGQIMGRAMEAATAVFEVVAGVLFGLVTLFFYLKDGGRIAAGIRDLFPARTREHVTEMGTRAWETLGSYFRGQLLIALVDAVFIGLGLFIIGVPLAVPLAVLVFFGGLFPIVGAVVSGALAVIVALADAGLTPALLVLALILAVQQLEGNILGPLVLGKAVALHPLVVLVAITAGAVTFGILGAFLAVPVAASAARVIDYLRGREGETDGGQEGEDDGGEEAEATPVMPSSS